MGKTLGQGSFATVKLATSKRDGGKWAIKIIKNQSLGPDDEAALRSEVEVLRSVSHPNIVELQEVFDCSSNFYMVMEVCSGGELFDRITEKDHYTELEAREALKQVAEGLEYCHDRNIVHRDLKPENLLYSGVELNAEGAPLYPDKEELLKLADFGLAKILNDKTMLHTACGTPGYVAPEILMEIPYSCPVDMWSFGVIAYILLCGFPPFYDDNNSALYRSIKSGKYDYPSPFWDDVSETARDFVDKLLVLDPVKRFTAKQALAHPFITMEKSSVSTTELKHFAPCMKSYNARRKFRAGIMSLQAISAMKQFSKPGTGMGGLTGMAAAAKRRASAQVQKKASDKAEAKAANGGISPREDEIAPQISFILGEKATEEQDASLSAEAVKQVQSATAAAIPAAVAEKKVAEEKVTPVVEPLAEPVVAEEKPAEPVVVAGA